MTSTLTGWPSGDMNAIEVASATAIASERGSSCSRLATSIATGAMIAATAAPLIAWVRSTVTTTMPARRRPAQSTHQQVREERRGAALGDGDAERQHPGDEEDALPIDRLIGLIH